MKEPTVKRPFKVKKQMRAKRQQVPAHVFLLPGERKFPVKRWDAKEKAWVWDCKALRAAITRAAQYGYRRVEEKARAIYMKECKK